MVEKCGEVLSIDFMPQIGYNNGTDNEQRALGPTWEDGMSNEQDTGANLLTLLDDEGQEHEFEMVDTADFEGSSYVALIPILEGEDLLDDSGELIILKAVSEGDEEVLESIEDDDEFDRVGAFFMERLKDNFDFEE